LISPPTSNIHLTASAYNAPLTFRCRGASSGWREAGRQRRVWAFQTLRLVSVREFRICEISAVVRGLSPCGGDEPRLRAAESCATALGSALRAGARHAVPLRGEYSFMLKGGQAWGDSLALGLSKGTPDPRFKKPFPPIIRMSPAHFRRTARMRIGRRGSDKKKNSHSAIPNGSKSRYALSACADLHGMLSNLTSNVSRATALTVNC